LKRLKEETICWANQRRIRDNQDLKAIEAELKSIYDSEGGGFLSNDSKDQLVSLEARYRKLLADREEDWRLKSRAIWLKSGDENTKFFQDFARGRKNLNNIWSLNDPTGRRLSSFEDLAQMGCNHFKDLFKAPPRINIQDIIQTALYFPKFVEEEDNRDLMVEVLEEELQEVLSSFKKDKSLGPDGWSIEFFQSSSDILGRDLLRVVNEARLNGRILAPFNATFIALIPKTDNPSSFEDFRLISLCNGIYKIIAKIISRRIKVVLSRSINPEQFGFLEGRQIHEAIGVAQEVLHSLKTRNMKGVVLKIDLSKAYDRVN
jgi:hypothetical protein